MKVFISYGRENLAQVQTLVHDLGALGHQVWFDQALTGGQDWWNHILANIRDCEAFVFALAPGSVESRACVLEYTYASQMGKTVLPVVVADGVTENLLPPALAQIQYIDYRTQDKSAVFALMKALNSLPAPNPLPEPLPQPPPVPVSYLGSLREQIESAKSLSFEEQTAILIRMKQGLRDEKQRQDVLNLLKRYRVRDDLLATVADEIDELLAGASPKTVASERSVTPRRTRRPP